MSAQCPYCFGRGWKPEPRKNNRGFYARTCKPCNGSGQIECRYWLVESDLDAAQGFLTKGAAVQAFADSARQLARYGQSLEATLHIANGRAELQEYPDFVLSLGPRDGVRVERA